MKKVEAVVVAEHEAWVAFCQASRVRADAETAVTDARRAYSRLEKVWREALRKTGTGASL